MTQAAAKAHGCRARVDFISGYPPLINDQSANTHLRRGAVNSLGAKVVRNIEHPLLGGEDFARYLEQAPGAMFHLGVRNNKIGAIHGWHHPQFTADERAISVGINTLIYAAVGYLND
jgi:metal-dependent amidase/aminoacylase/carboxypeptidase family protein